MGDLGSVPGLGSSPGEGNGNPLQYSCLENPMDRGSWQAAVHGIARVWYNLGLSFFLSSPTLITLAWGFFMLLPEWQSYWSNSSTYSTTIPKVKGPGHRTSPPSLLLSMSVPPPACPCFSHQPASASLSSPGWALVLLSTQSDPIWPSPEVGKGTSTAEGLRQMQGSPLVGHLVTLPLRSWSRA